MLLFDKFPELESCYGQLMSSCDMLEAIADFLPCHLDKRFCDTMTDGLAPLLSTTHHLEEQLISAGLCLIMSDQERRDAEEQWRSERVSDLAGADEVVDVLLALKAGNCHLSWDAVRYLLRSFFCSIRKHVKTGRETIRLIRRAADGQALHDAPSETAGEAA